MNSKALTLKSILFLALSSFSCCAFAQHTDTIDSGITTVTLSSGFVSALHSLDVSVGTVTPTHLADGEVSFPVVAGAVDLDTALGNILHSGGLTLTAGKTEVRLQSFIIDTTAPYPVITGLVVVDNKLVGRLPLFDLTLPAGLRLPLRTQGAFLLNLDDVKVDLDGEAAKALDKVFDVKAFKKGFEIGVANVRAIVNPQAE